MIKHFYHDIPGFFDFEGLYLDEISRVQGPATFVEVGVWKGRSLAFLGVQAANSGKDITIYGVDMFDAAPEMGLPDLLTKDQVAKPFLTYKLPVVLMQGVSWDEAAAFDDESLDFVFIDAGHDYASVKADLNAWWPKVKPGGTFAGHDYSTTFPGVVRAVEEKFGGPQKRLVSSWVVYK